jgi:hypothetical protein
MTDHVNDTLLASPSSTFTLQDLISILLMLLTWSLSDSDSDEEMNSLDFGICNDIFYMEHFNQRSQANS